MDSYVSSGKSPTVLSAKTNNSHWRQDVAATPHTTTWIYTPRGQAETDVDVSNIGGEPGDLGGKGMFLWGSDHF